MRFISVRLFSCGMILAGMASSTTVAQDNSGATSPVEGIPAAWLADYSAEVEAQVERFGVAYALPPDAQASLRQSLVAKLADQWQFESKGFQSIQQQIDSAVANGVDLNGDSEEARAITRQFAELGELGPLNDMVVAKELETTLDPTIAGEGRMRLVDLIARRDQINVVRDEDFEQKSSHNGQVTDQRLSAEAPITAEGNPIPRGEKLAGIAPEAVGKPGGAAAPSIPVNPNAAAAITGNLGIENTAPDSGAATEKLRKVQVAADALLADPGSVREHVDSKAAETNGRTAKTAVTKASRPAVSVGEDRSVHPSREATPIREATAMPIPDKGPSRPAPAAIEAVRLQSAPPLDDWDKYVDTTCKKFGFSDAQVIKAQSILKDLRNRAAAYRTSRNEDFAAAERLADAKAKSDRKRELSAPIDAFFEELKQRLDNLATLEQRAKAATPAPGKK